MSESGPSHRREAASAVPVGSTAVPANGQAETERVETAGPVGRFDGPDTAAQTQPFEPVRRDDADTTATTRPVERTAPAPAPAPVQTQAPVGNTGPSSQEVLARQKAKFGGMRFFLAFFGWLTATGLVVLLSALITGILAATGIQKTAENASNGTIQTASIIGVVTLGVVLFLGYFAGGYVAGRMARFSGLLQGLAVWLWALIVAIVVAAIGAIANSTTGAFSQLNASGLPISGATATSTGITTVIVAVVLSLLGALLGGLAGMRFHRKVDRFGARA